MVNPNCSAVAALKERSRFDAEPSSPTAWGDLSGESAGDKKQAAPSARWKVITEFIYPPIPTRKMDWMAYIDGVPDEGDNGPTGYGETEAEALKDLFEDAIDYAQTIAYADGRKDEAQDRNKEAA